MSITLVRLALHHQNARVKLKHLYLHLTDQATSALTEWPIALRKIPPLARGGASSR